MRAGGNAVISRAKAISARPLPQKETDTQKALPRERGDAPRYTSAAKPSASSGRVGGKRIQWPALEAMRRKMPNGPQA